MWKLRTALTALLAIAAIAWTTAPSPVLAQAQARQSVRAFAVSNGGRIIIEWPRPTRVTAAAAGTRIVLIFSEALDAPLKARLARLSKTVANVDISGDRRAVTLVLRRPHKVKVSTRGRFTIIELTDPRAPKKPAKKPVEKAAPKTKPGPEKAAKKPGATPKGQTGSVEASFRSRPTYDRLTFRWPEKVDYSVERRDRNIFVTFQRAGRLKLGRLRAQIVGSGLSVRSVPGAEKLVVIVGADPDRQYRHYRLRNNVVLEVLNKGVEGEVARKPTGKAPKALVGPKGTGERAGKTPEGKTTQTKPSMSGEPAAAQVTFSKPGGIATLRFDWSRTVTAAAFRRGRYIWLVFGAPAQIDLKGVQKGLSDEVFRITRVLSPGATAIRLETAPKTGASISRDGNAWLVALKPKAGTPERSLIVESQPGAPGGGRLFLKTDAAGKAVRLRDPSAGDVIFVVPVSQPGLGVSPARSFTKVRLLPTAQGVVVEPLADGVEVRSEPSGITVKASGGLNLSRRAEGGDPVRKRRFATGRVFDFDLWRGGRVLDFPKQYVKIKQKLQNAVTSATRDQRDARRMDLARFYFAHGQSSDAIGVLRLVQLSNAELARSPEFMAIRGANRVLINQLKSAGRDLFDRRLDPFFEIGLWRGAVLAKAGQWSTANAEFKRSRKIVRHYPVRMRTRLGLLVAEAAIRANELDRARDVIAMLKREPLPTGDREIVAFLDGMLLAKQGKTKEAHAIWAKLSGPGHSSRVRARASVERIEAELASGKLDTTSAAQLLERLRFAWRGDETEYRINELLGRVYMKAGLVEKGLEAMARARRINPDVAKSRKLKARMRKIFARLFLGGGADKLQPVRALGLFHEYADLIPAGPAGDQMIAALADRLVAVDLLDRAGALLTQQIEKRLQGVPRAKVGARLALLRLLDRKPAAAITALRMSDVDGMPEKLAAQRRRLRARALASLGKTKEALLMLGPDKSKEADLLRADIAWKAQDWKAAGNAYRRIASTIPANSSSLDEGQARVVLALAVTAALANDGEELKAIRTHYGAAMANGPYAGTFRIIANEVNGGGVPNYKEILAKVREVDTYQAFMSVYRKRLAQGGLQAVN